MIINRVKLAGKVWTVYVKPQVNGLWQCEIIDNNRLILASFECANYTTAFLYAMGDVLDLEISISGVEDLQNDFIYYFMDGIMVSAKWSDFTMIDLESLKAIHLWNMCVIDDLENSPRMEE